MTFGITLMNTAAFLPDRRTQTTKVVPRCVRCGSPLLYMSIHGLVYFFCPNCGYETVFTGFPSMDSWKENT
jgi:predicted RNA-binding Zn-ribbon protein involved in translation (DUF1610 family)